MKKGISPLIGTVLLIGFTIGLAILIFSWGGKFTAELTEETGEKASSQISCIYDVKVELTDGTFDSGTGVVTFFVDNRAEKDILSYTIGLIKDDGTRLVKLQTDDITGFGKEKITIDVSADLDGETITKVEILDVEVINGKCSDIREELTVTTV